MAKKKKHIEIRSEEVQEILTYIPNWMIRWGNTAILMTVFLLLILSAIVKYPDIIPSQITITTPRPPVPLVAKSTGKLDHIFEANNAVVGKDAWIAIIQNPTKYEDILRLKDMISRTGNDSISFREIINTEYPYLEVGEIQQSYNALINTISQYKKLKEDANYSFQLGMNRSKLNNYNRLIAETKQQEKLMKSEVRLIQQDYDRHVELHQKGVISTKELETKELELIRAKSTLESFQSAILRLNAEKMQVLKENKNLQRGENENVLQLELKIRETLRNTQLQFKIWEEKFVLKAPISGKVTFFDFWSQNQFVNAGDKVFTIIPVGKQQTMGICKMGLENSGKVKENQQVNVKLNAYPYREYGVLSGKIASISEVPDKEYYILKVDFPSNDENATDNSLITSYNKKIEFRQELSGTAEIITEDLTVAERIFYKFREVLNR